MKLNAGIEREKPRLGKCRYLRRIADIHNQRSTAFPMALGEVGRFGLNLLQDFCIFAPIEPSRTAVLKGSSGNSISISIRMIASPVIVE